SSIDPSTPAISTLSLHDALPICRDADRRQPTRARPVPGEDAARLPLDRLRLGLVRIGHRALERSLHVLLPREELGREDPRVHDVDRKSTRLNSSHVKISYAVFCL